MKVQGLGVMGHVVYPLNQRGPGPSDALQRLRSALRVEGLGFRVQGLGIRVSGLGIRDYELGFRD